MTTIALLKSEQNSVEFYTVEATGASGISESGLAKLCGVNQTTIGRLENTLMRSESSESLKDFSGRDLTLMRDTDQVLVNGKNAGNLKIYNAAFSVAVIKHYADKGNKEAIYSLMKFAEMGFDTWVQTVTGWSDTSFAQASQRAQPQLRPPYDREIYKLELEVELEKTKLERERLNLNSQPQPVVQPPEPTLNTHSIPRESKAPSKVQVKPARLSLRWSFERILSVLNPYEGMDEKEIAFLTESSRPNVRRGLVYLWRKKFVHRDFERSQETGRHRYVYRKVETTR